MQKIYFSSARNRALEVLDKPRKGAWVSVEVPSEAELEALASTFGLDLDLLRDATDIYESPRAEADEGNVYIYTRYCFPEGKEIATEPLLVIYTPDNLITISRTDTPIYDRLLKQGRDILTTQKTKTLLLMLEEINRSYRLHLNKVSRQVLRVRAALRRANITNTDFVQIIELEEDLNEFLAALQPQATMLKSLTGGKLIKLYEDDRDLVEDLQLSAAELIELTTSRLRTLTNIRQAYDAIATNNLNKTFKRLTSIAIFLIIPTIIGGLWGMNVAVPFHGQPWAFAAVLAIIAVCIVSAVLVFRRRNWL